MEKATEEQSGPNQTYNNSKVGHRWRKLVVKLFFETWYACQKIGGPPSWNIAVVQSIVVSIQFVTFAVDPNIGIHWPESFLNWVLPIVKVARPDWTVIAQPNGLLSYQIAVWILLAFFWSFFVYIAVQLKRGDGAPNSLLKLCYSLTWFLSTIAFIPIMSILIMSLKDCDRGALGTISCDSPTHIFRTIVTLFFALSFFFFALCCSALNYFNFPGKVAQASVHSRIEILGIIIRTLIIFAGLIGFGGEAQYAKHIALSLLFLILSLPMLIATIVYSPWINASFAALQSFLAGVNVWIFQCLLVTSILQDKEDPGPTLLLWYVAPLAGYISVNGLRLVQGLCRIRRIDHLRSSYHIEMKCRHFLMENNLLFPELHKTSPSASSKKHSTPLLNRESAFYAADVATAGAESEHQHEIFEQVREWYDNALQTSGSDDCGVWLSAGLFFLNYLQNFQRASVALSRAASLQPTPDQLFTIFCYRKVCEEHFIQESGRIVQHMNYVDEMTKVRLSILRAMTERIRFWGVLMTRHPNSDELYKVGSSLNESIVAAYDDCMHLINSDANNSSSLQTYASFLIHVLNDTDEAVPLIKRADKLQDRVTIERMNGIRARRRRSVVMRQGGYGSIAPDQLNPEECGILQVSVAKQQRGIIRKVNAVCCRLIGCRPGDLIGANVKKILPKAVTASHDEFIANFLRVGHSKNIEKAQQVFAMHSSGVLLPMHLFLRQMPVTFKSPEPLVMACVQQTELIPGEMLALVRHSTMRILNVNESWRQFFGMHPRLLKAASELSIPVNTFIDDFLYREDEYKQPSGALYRLEPTCRSGSNTGTRSLKPRSKRRSQRGFVPAMNSIIGTKFSKTEVFTVWLTALHTPDLSLLRLLHQNRELGLSSTLTSEPPSPSFTEPSFPGQHKRKTSIRFAPDTKDDTYKAAPAAPTRDSGKKKTLFSFPGDCSSSVDASADDSMQIRSTHAIEESPFHVKNQPGAFGHLESDGESETDLLKLQPEKNGRDTLRKLRKRILGKRSHIGKHTRDIAISLLSVFIILCTLLWVRHAFVNKGVDEYVAKLKFERKASTLNMDIVSLLIDSNTIVLKVMTLNSTDSFVDSLGMLGTVTNNVERLQQYLYSVESSLSDPVGNAYSNIFLQLSELDSRGRPYERSLNVLDALKAFLYAMTRISAETKRERLSFSNPDIYFTLTPRNYKTIIASMTKTMEIRHLHINDPIDIIKTRDLIFLFSVFCLCILFFPVLSKFLVQVKKQSEAVTALFLGIHHRQAKILRQKAIVTLQEHIDPQNGIWADVGEVTQMDLDIGLIINQSGNINERNPDAVDATTTNVAVDDRDNAADSSFRVIAETPSTKSCRPTLVATRRSSSRVIKAGVGRRQPKVLRRRLATVQRLRNGLSSVSCKLGLFLLICLISATVSIQLERTSFFSRSETSAKVFLAAERQFHVRLVMLSLLNAGAVSATPSEVEFWQMQARDSLRFITDVQQVLLFGGQLTLSDYSVAYTEAGTFVLDPPPNDFPKSQKLMFENACELLKSDSYRTLCETSYNGLFRRGLQNAITELTTRSHSVLRLTEAQSWPRTQTSIAAFTSSKDVRFISNVVPNTLRHLLDIASELHMDELDYRLDAFKYFGNVVLSVSIAFILIGGVIVGANTVFELMDSIKRSHMLLLTLPPNLVTEEVENIIDNLLGNATRKCS